MEGHMRVARMWVPGEGTRLGAVDGSEVTELLSPAGIPIASLDAIVDLTRETGTTLLEVAREMLGRGRRTFPYDELDRAPNTGAPHLLPPVVPAEVWAAGVTYERSREARLAETTTRGIYDKVYDAERPELFFKATPSRCVGPNVPVGLRCDSHWTVPEPELGVVIDAEGRILGYTLGNDMSARDIEGENPLYLPQTKIYRACCSIGPVLLLADEPVEWNLRLWCRIERGGHEVFRGETNTSRLRRSIPELVEYLCRANDIPPMTVLLTGTGIVPPDEFACQAGDIIEIGADGLGILRNPAVNVA
jgi:2-dehydro-3-deoxy-D-arabinonate dehydratase